MPVYLDNNATTMPDPRVVEAMLPFLHGCYANPSSLHFPGQQARHAVETARERIAGLLAVRSREVVFTSGGTESNHLAILGLAEARPDRRHVVTTAVEHDAVLGPVGLLEARGYRVTRLEVDALGRLDPARFEAALDEDTALASVMWANNETGVVFPIAELARVAAARGVPLHVDAVQAVGRLPIDLSRIELAALSFTAHKLHGPKGIGGLVVRRGVRLKPLMKGGGQERGLRPGTENVPGVVGLAEALALAIEKRTEDSRRIASLRDRLENAIRQAVSCAEVLGDPSNRLPNTACIGFRGLQAEALLMLLSDAGVCASSGSACSSGSLEPSHVLKAMGVDEALAHGAVRFSLSRFTTPADIDEAVAATRQAVARLLDLGPGPDAPAGPG